MSTDEERRILDDIKKTGYPLEMDVTRQFMEKGWSVFPEYIYSDESTGKLRTIDILAIRFFEHPPEKWTEKLTVFFGGLKSYWLPILLVEFKTSENPWVFFTTPSRFGDSAQHFKESIDMHFLTSHVLTFVSFLKPYIAKSGPDLDQHIINECLNEIMKLHFVDPNLSRAYRSHVVGRKEDDPNDFQKAIYQLRGASLGLAESFPETPISAVVVLRGKLFEYKTNGKLESAEHLLYTTFQTLPSKSKSSERRIWIPPVMIDVVVEAHLSEYLEKLEKDFDVLNRIHRILEEQSQT